jgi:hypothetical protein
VARVERVDTPSVDQMANLFVEMNQIKMDLESWKLDLPAYYEPISIPIEDYEKADPNCSLYLYPYNERLDYITGKCHIGECLLSVGFIGHTVNMYRAIILQIDRYLLGHMWPDKPPSEREIKYTCLPMFANSRIAKDIIMSLPGLNTTGGIFVLYPAMRASKVVGREEKVYIMSMLNKVADEVPVARALAMHILEFEHEVPNEKCQSPLSKKIWEIGANNFGDFGS